MTRLGWSKYYADSYNKTLETDCAHLSMWYQFLHEAFGDTEISPHLNKPAWFLVRDCGYLNKDF